MTLATTLAMTINLTLSCAMSRNLRPRKQPESDSELSDSGDERYRQTRKQWAAWRGKKYVYDKSKREAELQERGWPPPPPPPPPPPWPPWHPSWPSPLQPLPPPPVPLKVKQILNIRYVRDSERYLVKMQDNSVVEMRGTKPWKIDGFLEAWWRYMEVYGYDSLEPLQASQPKPQLAPSILGLARAQHSGTLYNERGKLRRDVWGFDLNLSDEEPSDDEDEDDGDIPLVFRRRR